MKAIICYYSGSGNTKIACEYIAKNMNNIDTVLFNIIKDDTPDLKKYDLVGFACFTDFGGPSYLIQKFIEELPQQNDKPAFVFNTFGYMSGKTQGALVKWIKTKGFLPIAGHKLHVPESYPPMIVGGKGAENAPNKEEMEGFRSFISELDNIAVQMKEGKEVREGKIPGGLLMFGRTKARKDMGEKSVDDELCTECGTCEKGCPYGAIILDPKPKFDMDKCYGCWYCYNHCPNKAIYTNKFHGIGHYPKPPKQLKDKLK